MLNTKTGEFTRQEIEHPYETAHRLSEWLRILGTLSSHSECGPQVAEKAVELLGAVACLVDVMDNTSGLDHSFFHAIDEMTPAAVRHLADTLKPKVALAGETVLIDNLDARFPNEEWISRHSISRYLGVPLINRDNEVCGTAAVFGPRSRRFNEDDESWLKIAGQMVVSTLKETELLGKLESLAKTLTPNVLSGESTAVQEKPQPTLVLVVDDDRGVNNLLSEFLTAEGYEVRQAFNGVEAMQIFQPAAHKLVITDVAMPLMNGWELVAALRVRAPRLPIVVVSGYSTGEWNPESLAVLGVSAILNKPLDLMELGNTVGQLVKSRSSEIHVTQA